MDPLSPFALIIGAIFVNNVVLAQFLGICPFLGVSKDVKSSLGMGGAVLFVMLLATLVTFIIYKYLLFLNWTNFFYSAGSNHPITSPFFTIDPWGLQVSTSLPPTVSSTGIMA